MGGSKHFPTFFNEFKWLENFWIILHRIPLRDSEFADPELRVNLFVL